jgi:hypothetical protein
MPKYKNIKEFVQPAMLNGKRVFIKPGQVIEFHKELDLSFTPFLEKVSDDAAVTHIPDKAVKTKKDKPSDEEIQQLVKNNSSLETKINKLLEDQQVILKRLEILKGSVETVNQALRNVEEIVYNDQPIVIEEDQEGTKP